MNTSKRQRMWQFVVPVLVLASMLIPATAWADNLPGGGSTIDPLLNEGVVYSIPSLLGVPVVVAGDVVLCDAGATCNSSTPTSQWSDVLVFYNSASGAFTADTSADANTAQIFSDSDGSLAVFLSSLSGGLSGNAQFTSENPAGVTSYGAYQINSPDVTPAPEPSSLILLTSGLFGVALKLRRKLAA